MQVSVGKKAIDLIIYSEIGNKTYYEKFLSRPTYPKGQSGVTIGFGYDLGYYTKEKIAEDWSAFVSSDTVKAMQSVCGLKSARAADAITKKLKESIYIDYDTAYKQFFQKVLIKQVKKTIETFKGVESYPPDGLGVLTSIVYNRGTDMTDNGNPLEKNRLEMRTIRDLIPTKNFKSIASQIRSMKRLWDGVPDYPGDVEQRFGGLIDRREGEATLMENCNYDYRNEDIYLITI